MGKRRFISVGVLLMNNSVMSSNQPPKIASQFLSWALPENIKEHVLGDLSEEYLQRIVSSTPATANYWYCRQAIKSGSQFMLKTQRGFIMFIFSILLFLGFTLMAMLLGGGISMYVDVQSLLIVFPPALAFAFAATSASDVSQAFAVLLSNDTSQSEQTYKSSQRVFSVLGNSGVVLGIFMTLIGWVAMGTNMDGLSYFGSAFAISILTLVYGIALKMLCYVAEQKILTLSERNG